MERSLKSGTVVVVEFPYSGYAGAKKRPALCIGIAKNTDLVLCQITSQNYHAESSVVFLGKRDFQWGELPRDSFIRPDKIFTFESDKVTRSAGEVNI